MNKRDVLYSETQTTRGTDRQWPRRLAFQISAIYLVVGIVWIAASDRTLATLVKKMGDPWGTLTTFQTLKGWAFVVITAVILYFLIRKFTTSIERSMNATQRAAEAYRGRLEQNVQARTADILTANRRLQDQIDQRKGIEAELRSAKRASEEASIAKSTFLANTTHEIRTPLTSILGYADLLADRDLSADQRDRFVTIVRQNAAHLLTLIDDLLDLSRIETGNLRVTMADHSPLDIAENTLELLRPRAVQKGLTLTLNPHADIPDVLRTDGVRLRQVLLNLVNNAIKFTPTGTVSLVVRGIEASGNAATVDNGWVQFDVIDTGIGIAAEHLAQIFEPFYQVEHGENRRYAGTGLGLAISRRLIEQMGGTLTVSSQWGKGSTFTVKVPLTTSEAGVTSADAPPVVDVRLAGRILLAEDNVTIRWLVEEYLSRAGATITAVSDGATAVDRVRRHRGERVAD